MAAATGVMRKNSYQLSVISYQLSVISYQLSVCSSFSASTRNSPNTSEYTVECSGRDIGPQHAKSTGEVCV
jgi:hypothetical protein